MRLWLHKNMLADTAWSTPTEVRPQAAESSLPLKLVSRSLEESVTPLCTAERVRQQSIYPWMDSRKRSRTLPVASLSKSCNQDTTYKNVDKWEQWPFSESAITCGWKGKDLFARSSCHTVTRNGLLFCHPLYRKTSTSIITRFNYFNYYITHFISLLFIT